MSEHTEQAAFIEKVRLKFEPEYPECKWLHAIPNESGKGFRAMKRTIQMKEEGQRKGVSDLCFPVPRMRPGKDLWFFSGLVLEFKDVPMVSRVRKNITRHQPSPEQANYLEFSRRQGHIAECVNGQDEALEIFEWYLKLIPVAGILLTAFPWTEYK